MRRRVEIDDLFEAAERIEEVFGPLAGTSPSPALLAEAESLAHGQIKTLCANLYAMAYAELATRERRGAWFLRDSSLYDFEELALEAADMPFAARKEDGFYEAVTIILRFFSGNSEKGRRPEAQDLFLYLRDVTDRNVNNVIRKVFSSEKSVLSYIHNSLKRHISGNGGGRYESRGRIVVDLGAGSGGGTRQAGHEDIVSLCLPVMSGDEKPGDLMDLAFDMMSGGGYSPAVEFTELRKAVFRILEPRYVPPRPSNGGNDPFHDSVTSEMVEIAGRIIERAESSYGWREGGSAEYRRLYVRAARYRLEELIRTGKLLSSARAFDAVAEGAAVDYSEVKGSWQSFWKRLWEDFLDFFRADG